MNEHRGAFPPAGSALTVGGAAQPPSVLGLREVALGRPVKQDALDFHEIWRVVAKWWWLIAAIAVGCLLAAIGLSLLVTPEYRAQATIEVNSEGVQVVKEGQVEPVQSSDREFLTTQVGLLRSRSLAQRVARSL